MNETNKKQFASDNYAGACPEVMEALIQSNSGFASAYGEDQYTLKAADLVRDFFETDCEVFFVYNGTAANSLAISSLCQSYHSVICHESAHIETDECGAVEFYSNGAKILLADGDHGKISPTSLLNIIEKRTDIHYPKPNVLSITQSNEMGTVYGKEEIIELTDIAKQKGLKVHMDGARFFNALVRLGLSPKEITWEIGVDALCLGGVKNGMICGETVVFFNRKLSHEFEYRCKQSGQLASKMRFNSAQLIGLLQNDVWKRNAENANHMAKLLSEGIQQIDEVELAHPTQANEVFFKAPQSKIEALKAKGWHFYNFIADGGSRLVCSWATQQGTVDAFLNDFRTV